ncbi:MAG: hypothetical protein J6Q38_02975 [Clostridia bacterium]|nr:hypothetical protein [Clostridia bacterium]
MKLFKKLIDWCFEENKIEPIKEEKIYIPLKEFFKVQELKEPVSEKMSATK